MKRRLLMCSAAMNVLLCGWLLRLSATGPRNAPVLPSSDSVTNSIAVAKSESDQAHEPDAAPSAKAALNWQQIESEDPRVYFRNLRALGCPDYVVRKIILSQVNDQYHRQALPLARQISGKFWEKAVATKTGRDVETAVEKEARVKWGGLDHKRKSLLKELLGDDWERSERDRFEDDRHDRTRLSFMSSEKQDAIIQIDQKEEALMRGVWQQRLPEAEQKALIAAIREQTAGEHQAVLMPEEWDEYKLRKSQFAHFVSTLYGVELSQDDMREIVRIKDPYGEDPKKSPELQEKLKAFLGEQRYADFERAQDQGFQQMYRVALRLGLPHETAVAAYGTKESAARAAQKIRAELPLGDAEAALRALRVQTEADLRQNLGEIGLETYLRNGGWWLRQLDKVD